MIAVHTFVTSNSIKIPIALGEIGLDYHVVPVNLRQGEQKTDSFKSLNPSAAAGFFVAVQPSPQPDTQARALSEVERGLGVLNQYLERRKYVAGGGYSIADIAHFDECGATR